MPRAPNVRPARVEAIMPQSAAKSAKTPATETKQPDHQQSVAQTSDTPPCDMTLNEATQSSSHPAEMAPSPPDVQSDDVKPASDSPSTQAVAEPALQTPHQTKLSRQDDAIALWRTLSKKLEKLMNLQIYDTWLRPLRALGFSDGDTLVLAVPSNLHANHVPKKFKKQVEQAGGLAVEFWFDGAPIQAPTSKDAEDGAAAVAASASEKAADAAAAARRVEKCPVLPEAAWHSLTREYREIVGPSTEASHAYHFACFVTAVGAALGRTVYIEKAGRHYPNLFVVLVGKSGGARKGTALHFGMHLAQALYQKIGIVKSLDSREGFLEHLAELEKQQEGRAGVSAIVYLAELRSLIEKTRMEGLGNIVPMLCDAYDCPQDLTVHTRKNPISVPFPTVSLCAATTQRWIEGLQMKDLEGGLGNRIMWVPGEPGRPIANPPARDQRRFSALVRNVRKQIAHWPQKHGTKFSLSPAAEARWEKIYAEIYAHHDEDQLIEILCQRLQNHCLKVALIWAALDGQPVIEQSHLEAAYVFTQFLYDSQWYLFRGFGRSPMAQMDAKIIEIVKRAGPNGVRQRQVKKLLHRVDAETLNRRLYALTSFDGPLVRVPDGQMIILYLADPEEYATTATHTPPTPVGAVDS